MVKQTEKRSCKGEMQEQNIVPFSEPIRTRVWPSPVALLKEFFRSLGFVVLVRFGSTRLKVGGLFGSRSQASERMFLHALKREADPCDDPAAIKRLSVVYPSLSTQDQKAYLTTAKRTRAAMKVEACDQLSLTAESKRRNVEHCLIQDTDAQHLIVGTCHTGYIDQVVWAYAERFPDRRIGVIYRPQANFWLEKISGLQKRREGRGKDNSLDMKWFPTRSGVVRTMADFARQAPAQTISIFAIDHSPSANGVSSHPVLAQLGVRTGRSTSLQRVDVFGQSRYVTGVPSRLLGHLLGSRASCEVRFAALARRFDSTSPNATDTGLMPKLNMYDLVEKRIDEPAADDVTQSLFDEWARFVSDHPYDIEWGRRSVLDDDFSYRK